MQHYVKKWHRKMGRMVALQLLQLLRRAHLSSSIGLWHSSWRIERC